MGDHDPTERVRTLGGPLAAALAIALLLAVGVRVRGLLLDTLLLGLAAAAIATPVGTVLAVLLQKTDAVGRRAAWLAIGGLMLAPLYLHAAAWQAGFGLLGWATQASAGAEPIDPWLSGFRGAVWVHAMAAVPWVAVITAGVLATTNREQEEAASLDADPARVLTRITLRRAAAGALISALLVVLICAAEMTATDLFNVRSFAEEVYTQASLGMLSGYATTLGGEGAPLDASGLIAGSLLLAVLAAVLIGCAASLVGDPNDTESGGQWLWRLGDGRSVATLAVFAVLLLVGGLPIANLLHKAGGEVTAVGDGWQRSWSAGKAAWMVATAPWEHRRELAQSLQLGAAVATAATVIGAVLAWGLRRSRRTRLLCIPLLAAAFVTPGPVLGVAAIWLLNQPPESPAAFLAWWYDHTMIAPWLVQTIRVTPLSALVVWSALASVPRETIDAAQTEGAGALRVLGSILLPMRRHAVAAAWITAFAGSVGELAATVLVLPPGPQTVTVRIFSLLHYGVEDRVAALSLAMVFAYAAAGGAVGWLLIRARKVARSADFPR